MIGNWVLPRTPEQATAAAREFVEFGRNRPISTTVHYLANERITPAKLSRTTKILAPES
jgi:hypothetical protein